MNIANQENGAIGTICIRGANQSQTKGLITFPLPLVKIVLGTIHG
jgi:hypothetical protein